MSERQLRTAGLGLAASVLALGLGEMALRVLEPPAASIIDYPCIYAPDERFGFRYQPSAVGRVAGHFEIDNTVQMNSLGFHDAEPLPPGTSDWVVFAVGDSFTAGAQCLAPKDRQVLGHERDVGRLVLAQVRSERERPWPGRRGGDVRQEISCGKLGHQLRNARRGEHMTADPRRVGRAGTGLSWVTLSAGAPTRLPAVPLLRRRQPAPTDHDAQSL